MAITFINCTASGNGGDGINLGKGSNALLEGVTANNNGRNGVTANKDSNVILKNLKTENNGLHGVQEVDIDTALELGLPKSIDIDKLKELIESLKNVKESERESVIKTSFLSDYLATIANSSTIIANITTLANSINL